MSQCNFLLLPQRPPAGRPVGGGASRRQAAGGVTSSARRAHPGPAPIDFDRPLAHLLLWGAAGAADGRLAGWNAARQCLEGALCRVAGRESRLCCDRWPREPAQAVLFVAVACCAGRRRRRRRCLGRGCMRRGALNWRIGTLGEHAQGKGALQALSQRPPEPPPLSAARLCRPRCAQASPGPAAGALGCRADAVRRARQAALLRLAAVAGRGRGGHGGAGRHHPRGPGRLRPSDLHLRGAPRRGGRGSRRRAAPGGLPDGRGVRHSRPRLLARLGQPCRGGGAPGGGGRGATLAGVVRCVCGEGGAAAAELARGRRAALQDHSSQRQPTAPQLPTAHPRRPWAAP